MTTNKRSNILDAALDLFAEQGYDGTTVPTIADKAQVGAGTIYRYFENKEVLVNSLFQECMQLIKKALLTKEPPAETPIRERFTHFILQLGRFANENDKALAFIDSHSDGKFLDETSKKMFEEFLAYFRGILDEGKSQGIISPLPSDALIAIVYGAFVKVIHVTKRGVVPNTPELLAQVEVCCWNAIRVH